MKESHTTWKEWQTAKIQNGLAEFVAEELLIEITDADHASGCFDLTMYKDGYAIKTAFWHAQDMEIPADCYDENDNFLVWERYFGTPEFLVALNYIDWTGEVIR